MRVFGFDISIKKSTLSPVNTGGGWFPIVREPYSGAWQNNDPLVVTSVLAYPPVYSCVSLIANDIGKLTPMVMAEDQNGILIEQKKSDALTLINNPNNYQNHIQFKQYWVFSLLITGNTYILKQRDKIGNIVKLYILDPAKVNVLVTETGSVYYQLNTDNMPGITSSITVPASEIIHDRINPLFHPLVGISPLYACGESATAGLSMINDTSRFFRNGAKPGGILTAPGSISDDTAARLKAYWDENFTGTKSGKVAIAGDGLKFEPMRMTSIDAQLIEQMKWTAESVCSAFHVPAYKIGVGTIPASTNVEALTLEYYTQCLQMLIESIELSLKNGLELKQGLTVELDLSGLMRMDTKTLMETMGAGVKNSVMAPNEARKRLNLKPLAGGDSVYMQQQNYSLEALSERDKGNPLGGESENEGMTEEEMKAFINEITKEFLL